MKIKRLDIVGFKSFVDKVSLDFTAGITAVVGPNGCGKSNIVDAIRWVMGEQSARSLRGRSMEDVIFGGSESRKPLGMAEVSLLFSTEDQRVPAKYLQMSEIQVTRRLYRDGESEYLINKTPCRLLDISELFMDTGAGAKAYSIIEQGRIGMILHSKPEERRFLIEEAAGVTKFKSRKQIALKKIELSRQNLLRVGDVMGELKRQLNSLQRQARKAEKFRGHREELKTVDFSLAAADFNLLVNEAHRLGMELAEVERTATAAASDVETLDLSLEEKRIALLEKEKALSLAQEKVFNGRAEFQTAENRLDFAAKELANLAKQKERLAAELASLQQQKAEAAEEKNLLAERLELLERQMVEGDVSLVDEEQALSALMEREREISRQLERTRNELFAVSNEAAQFGNQISAATRRLEGLQDRLDRSRREKLLLNEKLQGLFQHQAELSSSHQFLLERKAVVAGDLVRAAERERELKDVLEFVESDLAAVRDSLSRSSSRLHSLEELEASLSGYGEGVRKLLLSEEFRPLFSGVVADFVETDEAYETAVEAALGDRLQFVLSPSADDALKAVDYLKRSGGGRCTFIAGEAIGIPTNRIEGGRSLLDHVVLAEKHAALLAPLLENVYIASDLGAALVLSRKHPAVTFVTPEGDYIFGGGMINGGSSEAERQGIVHKKREIRELKKSVTDLTRLVAEKEAAREEVRQSLRTLEADQGSLRQEIHRSEINILECEKDLQRVTDEVTSIQERVAVKDLEDDQLREESETLHQELESCRSRRSSAEKTGAGLQNGLENLQHLHATARGDLDAMREKLTAIKIRVVELREKKDSCSRGIGRVEAIIADVSKRIDQHRLDLEKVAAGEERMTSSLACEKAALENLRLEQVRLENVAAAMRDKHAALSSAVTEEGNRLKEFRGALDEIRRNLGVKSQALSDLEMKKQLLENSIMERYATSIAALAGDPVQEVDRPALLRRREELQRLIEEIGEVNLTAIEEYQEMEQRYEFLSGQRSDLDLSIQSLQKAIQRINKTTRKRFLDTFQLVNERFKEVFPRLFCGGQAELRLTNEEDLLETGIDIVVQPPGKKLQNVTLLSGGEKALTAVALIFSIFLVKPSPFCLLDEVDAPLDDANIGRFNDMVREMTAFSQFIMITHNKSTMAVADSLFGVTMEEPGVSRLVSVRLN